MLMKVTASVGAENTVSFVPSPSRYEAATRSRAPFSVMPTAKASAVAPAMSVQMMPSADICHW
ncbi:hypothetical protein D9M68_990230 [compost metagenome]